MTVSRGVNKEMGVGEVAREAIRLGMINDEVLNHVLETLPKANTKPTCIKWYRCKMRRDGEVVKTNRELKAARVAA